MRFKTIITILFTLLSVGVEAKTFKTIKNPVAMAHNIPGGELKAREVVFRDTATSIHFTIDYPRGQNFSINSTSFLIDEEGNRYPLRSAEGITLNTYRVSTGPKDFTLHFEPMPKKVQLFDYKEADNKRSFYLMGIHDQKTKFKTPTLQDIQAKNPYTMPADWFKTDTITIKGRIEGFNAEQFGFTSMECVFEDVFEKDDATQVLDINPDGTFKKKFQISYPIWQSFHTHDSKVDFNDIPFFARPGETIDITIKKNAQGKYECYYNSGSSKEVERLLKSEHPYQDLLFPLAYFGGKFSEMPAIAESTWENMLYLLNNECRDKHYTPFEAQLALADLLTDYAEAVLDYAMYHEMDLMKQELRDGIYYTEILDSVEWNERSNMDSFKSLHRVDFDNPLMLSSSNYSHLLNRVQYATPVRNFVYKTGASEDEEEVMFYEATTENEVKRMQLSYEGWRQLMGCDHDNLIAQISAHKDFMTSFNDWRQNGWIDDLTPIFANRYTNAYIRQKTEQYYERKMAQKELSTPLPENNVAADLIRSISAKYPGRYLMIDFWGMGCGPCRSAIQSSKDLRTKIAKRDDIKLVFIAEERIAGGSDAYKNYVAEWLADEETICITNAEFARMQELFQFNGIPHYETFTPDCRRVRDDLRFNGYYNFDMYLKELKEKLK
jgi:thiol-disulfide isomerase/thioredoxin